MPETETKSADADTDDADEEEYVWASQTPGTRISGVPSGIIYAGQLDDTVAQNDTSFGLVLEDPSLVSGEAWENQAKPDDGTTADGIDEDESRPTDYRIADSDDSGITVANGALVTDEYGPSTYDEVDDIDADTAIVWYNGMSGERIARVLDFNGRPYARWTDDGYLVKGLLQPAEGWRGASGDKRREMKDNGKAPRVVRAPILRQRVDTVTDDGGDVVDATLLDEAEEQRVLIDVSRFQGGRAYEVHVFDADGFEDEFGSADAELPRDDGYVEDVDSELEMSYTPAADTILEQAEYAMHMYTGDGWQDEPDDWSPQSTAAVDSFGVSADSGGDGDEDGFTAAQEQFIREIVDELKGTGRTPETAFDGGIDGLVGKYSGQFDRVPDTDAVREEVYARVGHLSVDDLE